ncbi:hypothetical protein [Rhodanobacter lindaniclasticus]
MFGRKQRRQLQSENAVLRDALGFYADSTHWRRRAVHAKGEPVKWIKSQAAFDRGAFARLALSQLALPAQPVATTWIADVIAGATRIRPPALPTAKPDPSPLAASESRSTTQESS